MTSLERIDDPADLLRIAGPFLVRREAEHNLMLGLAGRLADDPLLYGEPPYAAVVRGGDGTVVAAALRTPPFNLILSEVDDLRSVDLVAADVLDASGALPGVLGPSGAAARFADVWRTLTGAAAELVLAQRIYRAERVEAPTGVAGSPRPYDVDADRELLLAWIAAFVEEALTAGHHPETPREHLQRREADPDAGYLFWEAEGTLVSMAGWSGSTPTGIRIGPVYTPPEHRRRGYASTLTAALTDRLLRGGRRLCFLFTDLANPTSNAIYARIGYEPVIDVDQYAFETSAES